MGHIAARSREYRIAEKCKWLIVNAIRNPLKTREFAAEETVARKNGRIFELRVNIYSFLSLYFCIFIHFHTTFPCVFRCVAIAVFPTCRESVFGCTYILFRAVAMILYIKVMLLFGRVYILFHIVVIILYINVLLFFGHAYILFQCLSGRFADKKRVRTQIHLSKRRDVENNCVTLLLVFAAAYGRSLIQ